MNTSHPILGNAVEETLAYIHLKAARNGTLEAYKKADSEMNGVWLLLKFAFDNIPYYSILISNMQTEINKGIESSEYREQALKTIRSLEGW